MAEYEDINTEIRRKFGRLGHTLQNTHSDICSMKIVHQKNQKEADRLILVATDPLKES